MIFDFWRDQRFKKNICFQSLFCANVRKKEEFLPFILRHREWVMENKEGIKQDWKTTFIYCRISVKKMYLCNPVIFKNRTHAF